MSNHVQLDEIWKHVDGKTAVIKRMHDDVVDVNIDGDFTTGLSTLIDDWLDEGWKRVDILFVSYSHSELALYAADGKIYDKNGFHIELNDDDLIPFYHQAHYIDEVPDFKFEIGEMTDASLDSQCNKLGYATPILVLDREWGRASWGKKAKSYRILTADGKIHEWLLEWVLKKIE